MFDKTKFLVVGDALLGVDRANNRLNAAKAQLETAKTIVESARADIESAKEGVTSAKSNLDTILAGFENSGISKAVILSTAEELNRVFSAVEPVVEQEVVAEPEFSKVSARKVIDSLRDLVSIVSERDDYSELRSPLEEIFASIQAVAGSVKDDSDAKPKRKRRSKNEEDDSSVIITETATVVSIEVSESVVDIDASSPLSEDVVVEPEEVQAAVAELEHALDTSPEVETVVELTVDEDVADAVVNEVNNDEVKDEIVDFIDSNVTDENHYNIIATTAFAVYLGSQDRPLSLSDFLDAMTLDTLKSADGADYLDDEMRALVPPLLADPIHVSSVLAWFVTGVRALENAKDFPAYEDDSKPKPVEITEVLEVVSSVEEISEAPSGDVDADEDQTPEEEVMTVADDATISGSDDVVAEDTSISEEGPLVLEEDDADASDVEAMVEEVETVEAIAKPEIPASTPAEKVTTPPARPTPSAPTEGLKKPNFFQKPTFPGSAKG